MPLFRISTLYCDPCPPIQIAPFLPVPVLSEKRPALLLLLINVFGIPDRSTMRRLPLYSVSASPPSSALQSYRLFYFNWPLSPRRSAPVNVHANWWLNDGCNFVICFCGAAFILHVCGVGEGWDAAGFELFYDFMLWLKVESEKRKL